MLPIKKPGKYFLQKELRKKTKSPRLLSEFVWKPLNNLYSHPELLHSLQPREEAGSACSFVISSQKYTQPGHRSQNQKRPCNLRGLLEV